LASTIKSANVIALQAGAQSLELKNHKGSKFRKAKLTLLTNPIFMGKAALN
jgi:hypothetical protein